jgi:hypothetical protein
MCRISSMRIGVLIGLAAAVFAGSSAARVEAGAQPIVAVVRHGGLCVTGSECRTTLRIGDRTISGRGYVPRPLSAADRVALLRAIGALDLAYLRTHPFRGTCPTAYDGSETIYRFRGFSTTIRSCTYDVRGIRAVQLADRLLGTLKAR